jgi:hypothetical protein
VNSPQALQEFLENRAAAAISLKKPLVLGEFGMGVDGHNGTSQAEWYRAFFESSVRSGAAGAMFWILTPDPHRGYGVTYTGQRDLALLQEISRASQMFKLLSSSEAPERLSDAGRHLIPRQFAWARSGAAEEILPQIFLMEDRSILYRFKPGSASSARFEKVGSGPGYFWGFGAGAVEYLVPAREDRRRVSEITVRAHLQPVLPIDARPEWVKTRVTLFVNGTNCGSRLIAVETPGQPLIQEWRVRSWLPRIAAMSGQQLRIRFSVTAESDWLFGVNISNWPEGYESHDAKPVEVVVSR